MIRTYFQTHQATEMKDKISHHARPAILVEELNSIRNLEIVIMVRGRLSRGESLDLRFKKPNIAQLRYRLLIQVYWHLGHKGAWCRAYKVEIIEEGKIPTFHNQIHLAVELVASKTLSTTAKYNKMILTCITCIS